MLYVEAFKFVQRCFKSVQRRLYICAEKIIYLCGEASYLYRATDFVQNNDRSARRTVGLPRGSDIFVRRNRAFNIKGHRTFRKAIQPFTITGKTVFLIKRIIFHNK